MIAVFNRSVGYYPRRALSLETQYRRGLLDPETGALRISHRDDNPWYIQVIESDFERQFLIRRSSSKASTETKAITFLAVKLKENPNLGRDADAWDACSKQFPTLSQRGFKDRVWPKAREAAGLEPMAPRGRKPAPKP
jgi:hypothetical protein